MNIKNTLIRNILQRADDISIVADLALEILTELERAQEELRKKQTEIYRLNSQMNATVTFSHGPEEFQTELKEIPKLHKIAAIKRLRAQFDNRLGLHASKLLVEAIQR